MDRAAQANEAVERRLVAQRGQGRGEQRGVLGPAGRSEVGVAGRADRGGEGQARRVVGDADPHGAGVGADADDDRRAGTDADGRVHRHDRRVGGRQPEIDGTLGAVVAGDVNAGALRTLAVGDRPRLDAHEARLEPGRQQEAHLGPGDRRPHAQQVTLRRAARGRRLRGPQRRALGGRHAHAVLARGQRDAPALQRRQGDAVPGALADHHRQGRAAQQVAVDDVAVRERVVGEGRR